MKLDKPLLVIDVETTGLDPAKNSVLQIAVVVVNRHLLKTYQREWDVNLENSFEVLTRSYKSAKKVHNIPTMRALLGGQDVAAVVRDLETLRKDYPDALIAGNNVGFDYAMLKKMFEQAERKNPFDYHLVDLTGLAAVHLGVTGLSEIAQTLGIDARFYKKHTAMGDAEMTADCLIALLKMIRQTDEYAAERVQEIGSLLADLAAASLFPKKRSPESVAAIEALNEAGDKHGF